MNRINYETDEQFDKQFPADAYRVRGYDGIAWRALGYETENVNVILCHNCEYCAIERDGGGGRTIEQGTCDECELYYSDEPEAERTGSIACRMVGDDRLFTFDADELTALEDDEYCQVCGQIGCGHTNL